MILEEFHSYLDGALCLPVLYHRTGDPWFAYWRSNRGIPPQGIVLHYTGGANENLEATAYYLLKKNPAKVSAHFLVGMEGEVLMLVPPTATANHAGVLVINRLYLAIEVVHLHARYWPGLTNNNASYPARQIHAVEWLCTRLCAHFRISPDRIVGHRDVLPSTICPYGMDVNAIREAVREALP